LTRLPTRNLSRDDRITSSHSLEVRYPFLSLSFLAHTSALPIHLKMDFRYPDPISHDKEEGQGEEAKGDKMILRVAAGRLGLEKARGRKKRAMQFGARSARLEVER
jgi:asparagine synthetase B (glutamine-hydrolysing)